MFLKGALLASFIVLAGMLVGAQSSAPVVTMSVTVPEGRTQELTAPESGLATVSLSSDRFDKLVRSSFRIGVYRSHVITVSYSLT